MTTIMEFLSENSIIAWIGVGIVAVFITTHFIKIFIVKMFKRIKETNKSKKSKLKVEKKVTYLNHDLTEIKDLDNKKFYYEAKKRDFFSEKKSFIKKYLEKRLLKKSPDKVVLIRMEMNNGYWKEFLVAEDEKDGFKHDGKKYIFDLDAKYYVLNSGKAGIWAYDFHESLTMPVKRTIPVNEIKSVMEQSEITEVENAVNPVTLERFIKSEIAQGILQGTMIGKLFKVMLILIIIVLVINAIDLVIDLMDSGVMSEIMKKTKG